jgi:UDPglucose--hexose-1-phosphate uridylyltransferase
MVSRGQHELQSHRRLNPLTGRHVLVSPTRTSRPWRGQEECIVEAQPPSHDPACFLCPGNLRANGKRNPNYPGVHIFDNDFAALSTGPPSAPREDGDLFVAAPALGRSRVICYSPDHASSFADLASAAIRVVIDAWCAESAALGLEFAYVQIFENKGSMMGVSSPHPHGQIWATDYLPDEIVIEDARQRAWLARRPRPMLLEIAEHEAECGERIVIESDRWLVIVPFWANWPFETLVLPRFAVSRLPDLPSGDREALARTLQELAIRYDNLFGAPFPYSMGWHGAPANADVGGWQLHAHFYPPLLRSASVRKFMVGFELLAEAQRDLTPEEAAERLRNLSPILYRARSP